MDEILCFMLKVFFSLFLSEDIYKEHVHLKN